MAQHNILNNIKGREEDILSLFILGHCCDVGLENFYDMLPILVDYRLTPERERDHNKPLQCPVPKIRVQPYFRL